MVHLIKLTFKDLKNFTQERKIFFHETSCNPEILELNCHQACAVESAALTNPNTPVHLLFVSPSFPSNQTSELLHQLLSYENMNINYINVHEYIKYTPTEFWFSDDLLKNSLWPVVDMADILRLVTIWKFGGIHLDLDFVITK